MGLSFVKAKFAKGGIFYSLGGAENMMPDGFFNRPTGWIL